MDADMTEWLDMDDPLSIFQATEANVKRSQFTTLGYTTDLTSTPGGSSCAGQEPALRPNPILCWGAELMGTIAHCSEQFDGAIGGTSHFKDKFCLQCTEGVQIPASRVAALTPKLVDQLANHKSVGFWKAAPQGMNFDYRIVNNTCNCTSPKLIVFRGKPPDLEFPPVPVRSGTSAPSAWYRVRATHAVPDRAQESFLEAGYVHFRLARGTLVPRTTMQPRPRVDGTL